MKSKNLIDCINDYLQSTYVYIGSGMHLFGSDMTKSFINK
jgi:hypothetical protein